MDIIKVLNDAGYKTVEGAENVLKAIAELVGETKQWRCSGYRVFPDGTKCEGCPDCRGDVPLP